MLPTYIKPKSQKQLIRGINYNKSLKNSLKYSPKMKSPILEKKSFTNHKSESPSRNKKDEVSLKTSWRTKNRKIKTPKKLSKVSLYNSLNRSLLLKLRKPRKMLRTKQLLILRQVRKKKNMKYSLERQKDCFRAQKKSPKPHVLI